MPLFLYSTSPAPHEQTILGACRRPTRPTRAVALLAALEAPDAALLDGLRGHFPVPLDDSGLASRDDAYDKAVVSRLASADLVLIGGGSPLRLVEVTRGTPALAALRSAYDNGAVLAGCSAGAAVFGAGMLAGAEPLALWGWLPNTVVAPHFGQYDIEPWRQAYPTCDILGIPDDAMAKVDGAETTSLGPVDLTVLPPVEDKRGVSR
ncbi:Type 1 glutamine amidotransferase-like domain-containing protein [Tenggerimyces flavus]|uniref:Type 1 glutamine amidotransferase-like domain-containing protein n=1 Tax=Tenggerimyces flavus TaxID=1708749 RepID=A0ABV7YA03_9ACTN|nr:Type 1 glutamine amidotransferase-like domain-containing protein [Tenggerimyces flavus]MBM7785635.1 putative intracellular protease/amidase [Tenggerimyces flavus]